MTENKLEGRVKWFNHRKGYGFVEIITSDSEFLNKDIFLHFSHINTENKFKKVFPGEYISLNVIKNPDENNKEKEYICDNVKGIHGYPLLIENEKYNYKVIEKK